MHFADVADGAGPDVFDGRARIVEGMALVAHLRGDFGIFRSPRHFAGFLNGPSERFLDVDVFVKLHGGERDRGVHVVGGGHQDGVNVLLAVEHFAIILVALGFRQMLGFEADHGVETGLRLHGIKLGLRLARGGRRGWMIQAVSQPLNIRVEALEALIGVAPVHIAQGHNVLAGKIDEVLATHAANADAGDVEHVAGRRESPPQHVSRHERRSRAACRDAA